MEAGSSRAEQQETECSHDVDMDLGADPTDRVAGSYGKPEPRFVVSHFLMCKHLVRSVRPVDLEFFFEVERNQTTPFYSHPGLVELSLD